MNITNKIINTKKQTSHTIDVVESFDGNVVVFTKDKKCFPINEVKTFRRVVYDFVKKIVEKKPVSDELSGSFLKVLDEIGFIDKIKSTKITPFDEKDFIY
jgi:hypothetical protein